MLSGLLGTNRPATTPGAAAAKGGLEEEEGEAEDDVPLKGDEVGLFRSYAARANYLAMDRPELAYLAKELCRRMKEPTRGDLRGLRRIAQYLANTPRLAYEFAWQDEADLQVFTDTDFAGCRASRRSTSGGCACEARTS